MADRLRDAYEHTDFEIVETGANLEIPTSTSAAFSLSQEVDPAAFQNALHKNEYSFIAPYTERSRLSSKVYDAETNEFFHVKLSGSMLRVFPKSEEFSFETFTRVVEVVEDSVGVSLEYQEEDDG